MVFQTFLNIRRWDIVKIPTLGMSGNLKSCLSDAVLLEFMALTTGCEKTKPGRKSIKGPIKMLQIILFFQLYIVYLGLKIKV